MLRPSIRIVAAWLALYGVTLAQQPPVVPPPGFTRAPQPAKPVQPGQQPAAPPAAAQEPAPAPPKQQPPAQAPGQQQPASQAPGQPAAPPAPASTQSQAPVSFGGLALQNASLTEVIDMLARMLHVNYVLDPTVKGGVYLNTYGDTSKIDPRSLLDSILRINGFAMVQTGDIYRIVKMADALRLPIRPALNAKDMPEDDQVMLNLVFLKYASADELAKLLDPFTGTDSKIVVYPPANLLLILDSRRSLRRTMDLIALFDNEEFVSQRVRLFEVKNRLPSELSKELEGILKAISLNDKSNFIRLLPLDRISTLVGIATNPTAFQEVEKWLKKLDIIVTSNAGSVDNYVYRVKYQQAPMLAMAIMQLYLGIMFPGMMMGGYGMYGGMGGMYGGMGGMYGGMGGMYGGMGGMYGGMGGYGGGMYGMGAMNSMYGNNYGPTFGGGMSPMGMMNYGMGYAQPGVAQPGVATAPAAGGAIPGVATPGTDLTGSYLGAAGSANVRIPRVVPNPMDNTLLIQATASEYEQLVRLLRELDVAPRQVLIEAKIYEVSLTGALASGVSAFLQARDSGNGASVATRQFQASLDQGLTSMSAGLLVGRTRELLAFLSAREQTTKARVISAPSIIATDSIPASMNVGTEVPTLAAQAPTSIQSGGSSLFAQSIQNRNSGVTLSIVARINPSGIVTLIINQEVSAPQPPSSSASIQSPSFSKRTIQTQITMQDGDTIAIGGIMNETNTQSSGGIPVLHRLPLVGAVFGSKSYGKEKTELIIFMTPRVIYDATQIMEASDELKGRLQRLRKYVQE